MPPFLSAMEEAKTSDPDLTVRYALSAFEDLNSAIKNLRRCFGFPYQEYIGCPKESVGTRLITRRVLLAACNTCVPRRFLMVARSERC